MIFNTHDILKVLKLLIEHGTTEFEPLAAQEGNVLVVKDEAGQEFEITVVKRPRRRW